MAEFLLVAVVRIYRSSYPTLPKGTSSPKVLAISLVYS